MVDFYSRTELSAGISVKLPAIFLPTLNGSSNIFVMIDLYTFPTLQNGFTDPIYSKKHMYFAEVKIKSI
jgi:hypothetical protein